MQQAVLKYAPVENGGLSVMIFLMNEQPQWPADSLALRKALVCASTVIYFGNFCHV